MSGGSSKQQAFAITKYIAFTITFPTGVRDVGIGQTLEEAASYALRAAATPWCVRPERRELNTLREQIAANPSFKGKIPCH